MQSELFAVLHRTLGGRMNAARIKFFGLFICALCRVQTVCFEKLSCAFDTPVERGSSLRRIQRFMAEYVLDSDLIAKMIFALLPHRPPYTLALDRTSWRFSTTCVNVLMLAVVYHGVAFPLLFSLLDKRGNSSTDERIALVERYIRLFGREQIESLVADREFVGSRWVEWLNLGIAYHIRIRNNFMVSDPRTGKTVPAWWLFNGVPQGQVRVLERLVRVGGQLCYLSGSKTRNKQGKLEYQILASFNKPDRANTTYKERWQIEMTFKALKSSGFNIEDTHLNHLDRIEKLLLMVIVAFTWAYRIGIHVHRNIKPIRSLKHGYKAKSIFKYGLETILSCLLNNYNSKLYKIYQIFVM